MGTQKTSSILLTRTIVHAAVRAGAEREELCAAVGIDPTLLDDPKARVPSRLNDLVFQEGIRLSGDEALGIHAGEWIQQAPSDVLWQIFMNSATLREGIGRVRRYYRLFSEAAYASLKIEGHLARLSHHATISGKKFAPVIDEWTMAIWFGMVRRLVGADFALEEVRFVHPRPAHVKEYLRYFGGKVSFGRPATELVFSNHWLDVPAPGGDPQLQAALTKYVEEQVARMGSTDEIVTEIQRATAEVLIDGPPRLGAVSARLALTPRNLQRKLRQRETSFITVVDGVRSEFAKGFLQNRSHSILEVAFLLGFSDQKAFYRAFRRWSGTTPARYRETVPPLMGNAAS